MTAGLRRFRDIRAITFDFGNTLVPVRSPDLRAVVDQMIEIVATRIGGIDPGAFGSAWAEERERQFREDVPRLREVDLDRRVVRVLARQRGMPPPAPGVAWDDAAAAARSTPAEVELALAAYSRAFVGRIPAPPEVGPLLERLAGRFSLAILSNWPLAITIDEFLDAAGWRACLAAVVVSQRVGAIKPDQRIFRVAETELGQQGPAILHLGDDWAADVVGAKRAGWQAAYLRDRQAGSPLPASTPDASVSADLVVDSLQAFEAALG